jgi:hypothetical protein
MAVSESDVKKAFRNNNFRISDAAVASRIAGLAEERGYSAHELSDAYDTYMMNRRDGVLTGALGPVGQTPSTPKQPPPRCRCLDLTWQQYTCIRHGANINAWGRLNCMKMF